MNSLNLLSLMKLMNKNKLERVMKKNSINLDKNIKRI